MASKKVVMTLTNGYDPDVRVHKEATYLVKNGVEVTVLCWDRNKETTYPERETIDGVNVVRYRIPSVAGSGKKQIPAYLKFISCCKKYLAKNPCDYLHCNDLDGAIVGLLTRKRKTPFVFDMHEYYEDVKSPHNVKRRIMRAVTIFVIKKSIAALYDNTLYLREPYKKVQAKLYRLKNYPDSQFLVCKEKTPSPIFRIGYHGAVRSQVPQFTTLFEAVKGMDDVRVDIHGNGPDHIKLKKIEKDYKNVYIHGTFNGTKELTDLYANADVEFMGYAPYSSRRECAEVVKFFECILTGTPMILTETYTGMGDKINKFGWGVTCDTLDVEAVKAAIVKLKTDREFWQQCSENEKKYAGEYDWANEVKVLDTVYSL